jgi:hypothetical protein
MNDAYPFGLLCSFSLAYAAGVAEHTGGRAPARWNLRTTLARQAKESKAAVLKEALNGSSGGPSRTCTEQDVSKLTLTSSKFSFPIDDTPDELKVVWLHPDPQCHRTTNTPDGTYIAEGGLIRHMQACKAIWEMDWTYYVLLSKTKHTTSVIATPTVVPLYHNAIYIYHPYWAVAHTKLSKGKKRIWPQDIGVIGQALQACSYRSALFHIGDENYDMWTNLM